MPEAERVAGTALERLFGEVPFVQPDTVVFSVAEEMSTMLTDREVEMELLSLAGDGLTWNGSEMGGACSVRIGGGVEGSAHVEGPAQLVLVACPSTSQAQNVFSGGGGGHSRPLTA